jgi:2-oxoisovalerate dehydrogenase E2 component (dihydrolipoyl transacylase)
MAQYIFKLPDLGEGMVESEIAEWRVKPGDTVAAEQPLVDMMTDKATVEITAPVAGRIVSLGGKPGDMIPVGAELVVFETGAAATPAADAAKPAAAQASRTGMSAPAAARTAAAKILASPAVRRRAQEAGVELDSVRGTGPEGRISQQDLDEYLSLHGAAKQPQPAQDFEEIPVIGLRRKIAEKMAESKRHIPHFTYVEEVDLKALEFMRQELNEARDADQPRLTYLPFLVRALVRVLRDFPQCNAHFDDSRNVVKRFRPVHVGIATQTDHGLMVPVIRHAEALDLRQCAAEIARLAEAARNGKAKREELSGSTITITSLGALGGIVSTPVINYPEVAIIGVNKAELRPVVREGQVVPRLMMNLSSAFDHRVVDGMDAARLIQAVKNLMEKPDTLVP